MESLPNQDSIDAEIIAATGLFALQNIEAFPASDPCSYKGDLWPLMTEVSLRAKKSEEAYARFVLAAIPIIFHTWEKGLEDEAKAYFIFTRDLAGTTRNLRRLVEVFSNTISRMNKAKLYAEAEDRLKILNIQSDDPVIINQYVKMRFSGLLDPRLSFFKEDIEKALNSLPSGRLPKKTIRLKTLTIINAINHFLHFGFYSDAFDLWVKRSHISRPGKNSLLFLKAGLTLVTCLSKTRQGRKMALNVIKISLLKAPRDEKHLLTVFQMAAHLALAYQQCGALSAALDLLSMLPDAPQTLKLAKAKFEIAFLIIERLFKKKKPKWTKKKNPKEVLDFFFSLKVPRPSSPCSLPFARLSEWLIFKLVSLDFLPAAQKVFGSLNIFLGEKLLRGPILESAATIIDASVKKGKADDVLSFLKNSLPFPLWVPGKGVFKKRISRAVKTLRERFLKRNEPKKAQNLSLLIRSED
jgi:hypothetical protein